MQMSDTVTSPEIKEALRQRRNDSLSKFFRHSAVSAGLAFVGVAVGIASIVVGVDNGPWHLAGGSLIPGIMISICAVLGYQVYQAGRAHQGYENVGAKAKCFFVAHYVLSLLTALISLAFIALSAVGIVWCSGVEHYYVRINRITYKKNTTCPENKTAAIVTSGLSMCDSFLISVWCILGTVFFCCYFRAFGVQRKYRYYP
ncbi:uncharacterized protein LOC133193674 [Saccostrea echinata]|uniref:uncharacterized protein LOC133193674 n=1 Tax=Saccostrea echinata TaxID=191078 RepID=UPI002A81F19A|nr:uncharacterized protein LOC133193674 [Saccostrea echinata]